MRGLVEQGDYYTRYVCHVLKGAPEVRSYRCVYKERNTRNGVSSLSTGVQYRAPVDNLFTSEKKE
jgi:hypothetical protein